MSIKITSHIQNQTVPANKPLKISGISSDNVNSNCTVYADWNDQKPLQKVTPAGPNGSNDSINWTFTYTSNYHVITEGANELTSKLDCGSGLTKYYTVNVTGIKEQQGQMVGASANETATSTSMGDPSASPLQSTTPSLVSPPSSSSSNTNDESDISSDDETQLLATWVITISRKTKLMNKILVIIMISLRIMMNSNPQKKILVTFSSKHIH